MTMCKRQKQPCCSVDDGSAAVLVATACFFIAVRQLYACKTIINWCAVMTCLGVARYNFKFYVCIVHKIDAKAGSFL